MQFDVIIGNPPYGVAANLAIKFVNISAQHTDDIRMVLPASFQRDSVKNRISMNLELVQDIRLPDSTFPRSITTVRQRWIRAETPRTPVVMHRDHPDFKFLKYSQRDEATLFIGGAGAGPSGKVKTEGYDHYKPGHHYIQCDEVVKQRLIDLQPKFIEESRICGCLPGLSKHAIITIYNNHYG
jgi:hypothetical protein